MWPVKGQKLRFEVTERGNLAIEDQYGRMTVLNPAEVAQMLQVIEQDPVFQAEVQKRLTA